MANITHTQVAAVNPTAAPPSIGAHYTNTVTGQRWIAKGTASPLDWGQPVPGITAAVPNSVMAYTVDILQPSAVWRITGFGTRSIIFPYNNTTPGLSIVELLIDNAYSQDTVITIDDSDAVSIIGRTEFVLIGQTRNYFRFANYVTPTGSSSWQILDEHILNLQPGMIRFIPGSQTEATLTPTPETTLWNIDGPRTLTLPEIPLDQFLMFLELNVIFNAKFAGECVITIDPAGQPLIGHSTLTIPAGTAQLYKLACFYDNNVYFWSVVSVTNLTA